jgi:hypothetical protein
MVRFSQMAGIAAAALALSACGGAADDKASLDKLDTSLGGKGDADPALTAALEDQIMVDPTLSGQANEDSIRPPTEPASAPIPAAREGDTAQTLGGLATDQAITANKDRFTGCSLDVQYSTEWANRLPIDLPLYPQARVAEAGGSDTATCKLRAVTFASAAAPRAMVDFYLTLAKRAGYSGAQKGEGNEVTVSGTRPSDGGAFYAIISPSGSGSSVDLVSNRGR